MDVNLRTREVPIPQFLREEMRALFLQRPDSDEKIRARPGGDKEMVLVHDPVPFLAKGDPQKSCWALQFLNASGMYICIHVPL